MISSKTPSQKKLKKIPHSKQSYIFKKKKKVYLRTSRNPSFHPSYQIPLQSQEKIVPTKKDALPLLIQPEKFTTKKEIRKNFIPSKKIPLPSQSFLKKRRQFSSEKVVSLFPRLARTQRKLSGRQRKFFRLLPNVIYRKRRRRRKTPHQFIRILLLFRKKWALLRKKEDTTTKKSLRKRGFRRVRLFIRPRLHRLVAWLKNRRRRRRGARTYFRIRPRRKYPHRSSRLRLLYLYKTPRSPSTFFEGWTKKRLQTFSQPNRFGHDPVQLRSLLLRKIQWSEKVNWGKFHKKGPRPMLRLNRPQKTQPEKPKLYLRKKSTISVKTGTIVTPKRNPLSHGRKLKKTSRFDPAQLKKGIREFSTWTRLIPPKRVRLNRRALRLQKQSRPYRSIRRRPQPKKGLKKNYKKGSLRFKRSPRRKRRLRSMWTSVRQGSFKKRPYVFKRRKWRFPRWKRFPRVRGRWEPTRWQRTDLFPYRLYRKPHQPYRRRKPWQQKKHKRLRLIRQKTQAGRLLRRSELITLQKRYFQVYSHFYGSWTPHQLHERARSFRRSATFRDSLLSLALTWFDHRLDVTLCRLRLAPTIKIARLLVRQGYIRINGTQTRTPHHRVETWDLVQITLESDYFFGKYWYSRNKYQRHLYRQPGNRFKHVYPQKVVLPFGFFTRYPRTTDLPRYDRLSWQEFGRLLLI